MKRIMLLALAIASIAACADSSTSPSPSPSQSHALREEECTELMFVTCGPQPHIDSISPNQSGYSQLDMNGHPVSGQYATFVCVYGQNLSGGYVNFDGSYAGGAETGCGNLVFNAPVTSPGDYAVTVVTNFGESNAVTFTRH